MGQAENNEQNKQTLDNVYMWLSEGLGIRSYPSGRRVYVVQYREFKMLKIKTLAEFGAITLEQAQDLAKAFRRKLPPARQTLLVMMRLTCG